MTRQYRVYYIISCSNCNWNGSDEPSHVRAWTAHHRSVRNWYNIGTCQIAEFVEVLHTQQVPFSITSLVHSRGPSISCGTYSTWQQFERIPYIHNYSLQGESFGIHRLCSSCSDVLRCCFSFCSLSRHNRTTVQWGSNWQVARIPQDSNKVQVFITRFFRGAITRQCISIWYWFYTGFKSNFGNHFQDVHRWETPTRSWQCKPRRFPATPCLCFSFFFCMSVYVYIYTYTLDYIWDR